MARFLGGEIGFLRHSPGLPGRARSSSRLIPIPRSTISGRSTPGSPEVHVGNPELRFFNIAKVAFGLGFVIFIHELGHFLLAKWNGVKVEKFSIGFGPTLLGLHTGRDGIRDRGGPARRVRQDARRGARRRGEQVDRPAAYTQQVASVPGWRSSRPGVIMNVILGLGCFVYRLRAGHDGDACPGRRGTIAGSPAYAAGMSRRRDRGGGR